MLLFFVFFDRHNQSNSHLVLCRFVENTFKLLSFSGRRVRNFWQWWWWLRRVGPTEDNFVDVVLRGDHRSSPHWLGPHWRPWQPTGDDGIPLARQWRRWRRRRLMMLSRVRPGWGDWWWSWSNRRSDVTGNRRHWTQLSPGVPYRLVTHCGQLSTDSR